jgi:soluble lytic murein transglycosylase
MNKRLQSRMPTSWVKILPLVATVISIGAGVTWCRQQQQVKQSIADPVLKLIDRPDSHPERLRQRTAALKTIAKQQGKSISGVRARYILATEAIAHRQSDRALNYLQDLEQDYPILAPQIIWNRAQAYQLAGKPAQLNRQLQLLTQSYPKSPVVVEAWNLLGQTNDKYWDLAIEQFPSHPRTLEIVQQKLAQTPNRPDLLLILVKYFDDNDQRRLKIADKLVTEYPNDLKPTDWDLIGLIYWQNKVYNKVAIPLKKGSKTASNACKIANSHLLSKQPNEAKVIYQEIVDRYPQSPEAAESLLSLADLSPSVEALTYLDRVVDKFPSQSVNALVKKAQILERNQNRTGAAAARVQMVRLHPHTEEVAAYRWQLARAEAKLANFDRAWALAKQIVIDSPDSKYSPRAAFWIGKWAQKLGKPDEAKQAFTYTITNYPRSYYSWRSAKYLGWDVGDFNTIKSLNPAIVKPQTRLPLPSGSDALKELYAIGQDHEALDLWQTEFLDRQQPTAIDRLTQSILENGAEKYITSIVEISHIEDDLKTPEQQLEFAKIRQQPSYWRTLYPLAFIDIIQSTSTQRKVNPLLTISIIRQESKFSPIIKSPVGALGLMQVIPDTAKFAAYKLGLKKYDLIKPEDNVQLGTWYLNFTHEQVKHNSALAVAGYNAGPGNVTKWVKQFGTEDLDEFVEQIPFEETQNYVKNVLGNYWNYLRLYNPAVATRMKATQDLANQPDWSLPKRP